MSSFLFELPTTGAVSFSEFCSDPHGKYTLQMAEATQSRANVRAALKESKRTDGEKDYLRLVKTLNDYLPHLYGLSSCLEVGQLAYKSTPHFSWRTTLSSNVLNSSPRITVNTLLSEIAFTLLTYGSCLANLARASVVNLGAYETQASLSEADRKAKDEKLNFAVTLLCKASGVFQHVSDVVIGQYQAACALTPHQSGACPPELTREVPLALSKMALADAQVLATRKLRTKAAIESAFRPGPPLPKSHPSPALISKLHLEAGSLYASARALAKNPAASTTSGSGARKLFSPGKGSNAECGEGVSEVAAELRRYLADAGTLQSALGHMWLGIEAGEPLSGAQLRAGDAVGLLGWAKADLESLKDGGSKAAMVVGDAGEREKEMREARKEVVKKELETANVFWKHYKKMNDSLSFDPVPSQAELQANVPAGRLAVAIKPFTPPAPAFGPGSVDWVRREAESLDLNATTGSDEAEASKVDHVGTKENYVGAGSYF